MKPNPITERQIATRAGVSQATVSMSLANHPRIAPVTRERIQALARKLGYCPNPYVSTLMRSRRQRRRLDEKPVIALVCTAGRADGWRCASGPTTREMHAGALERAALRGYAGQDFWLRQDGMSNTRFSEMLHARGIRGVLIGPVVDVDPPPVLHWDCFSVVGLSAPFPFCNVTTVCNDYYFSSLLTARECHRLGYRRPGLVILKAQQARFYGRWEAGFHTSCQALPGIIPTKPLLLAEGDFDRCAPLRRWLKSERPDVIISSVAREIHPLLLREGWRIPEKIGLASLNSAEPGHPISGSYQNGRLLGATAMDTLISMIERNEKGLPEHGTSVMIEGRWNPGTTLRQVSP